MLALSNAPVTGNRMSNLPAENVVCSPMVPWERIDTVLLDMDGTLLDLRFDNWFWQDYVPGLWAKPRGLTLAQAQHELAPVFQATMGTLAWYCIDHWSATLDMDIHAIKDTVREEVRWLQTHRTGDERAPGDAGGEGAAVRLFASFGCCPFHACLRRTERRPTFLAGASGRGAVRPGTYAIRG